MNIFKNSFLIFFFITFTFSLIHAEKTEHLTTRHLQYYDPLGREIMEYKEVIQSFKDSPFIHGLAQYSYGVLSGDLSGEVVILVNTELYNNITLDTFLNDISSMGYSCYVDTLSGGTPQDVRNILQNRWNNHGAVGTIIIGDLPIPWYYHDNGSWGSIEIFPIDYYYMDLDGTWGDGNGDGIFDSHSDGSGDKEADIWLGRLTATYLSCGDEVSLIENYLHKNHLYRTGNLQVPSRALAFNDDDWPYGDPGLSSIYGSNVQVVENSTQTTAQEYSTRLQTGYEFVHLMAHSSPWTHTFYPDNVGGTFYSFELFIMSAPVHFLNLFCCSGTRYVERDNTGTSYIFRTDYGLGAVGSAKTGAMLYFSDYYTPLGNDSTFGGAFAEWMVLNAEYSPSWFYGLTYLGDPTLKPAITKGSTGNDIPAGSTQFYSQSIDSSRVTTYTFTDAMPYITTMPNGYPIIVWSRCQDIRTDIFESHYNGSVWSSPQEISGSGDHYWDLWPSLINDNHGTIYMFWQGYRWNNGYDIAVVSSTDNGSTWSNPETLTSAIPYETYPKTVVDSNGTLWCFFKSVEFGVQRIYQVNKPLYGIWSNYQPVTPQNIDIDDFTSAVATDSNIYILYTSNNDIYEIHYNGSSWSSPLLVESNGFNNHLSLAVSGDNIICAYHSEDGIKAIINNGSSWQAPEIISTTQSDHNLEPVAVSSEYPSVIWRQNNSGNWEITSSIYFNSSWTTPVVIAGVGGTSAMPSAVSIDSTICIAYCSYIPGNWEIYYEQSVMSSGVEEDPSYNDLFETAFIKTRINNGNVVFIQYFAPENTEIEIYDALGRKLSSFPVSGYGERNIDNFQSGVYFIKMKNFENIDYKIFLIN